MSGEIEIKKWLDYKDVLLLRAMELDCIRKNTGNSMWLSGQEFLKQNNIIMVLIKKLHEDVEIPQYATAGSSGFDLKIHNLKKLYSSESIDQQTPIDVSNRSDLMLTPNSRILIGCGFAVKLPNGFELQIRSRSGNTLKKGLVVANSPGTIDSDYTGEIGVILINTSSFEVEINIGDTVAQAVLSRVEKVDEFQEVYELPKTDRGEGGFGSTDKK